MLIKKLAFFSWVLENSNKKSPVPSAMIITTSPRSSLAFTSTVKNVSTGWPLGHVPTCRTLALNGVWRLPYLRVAWINLKQLFFVNRMKEVHFKLGRVHGKVEAKCEMCSRTKAEDFCRQCAMFICEECKRQHSIMKVFVGHKITSLDELKEGGAKEIIIQEPPLQMCKEHDEPMKTYCFDCNCLICRDCTINITDHFGHNHKFIKKAAPEMKKNLLKEAKVSLSRVMKKVQSTQFEVRTQGDAVTNVIKSSFEHFCQIIKNFEQELLKEVERKVMHKNT